MTLKTKMMLIAGVVTLVLPVVVLGLQLDDVRLAMDDGHDKIKVSDIFEGERPGSVHVTVTGGLVQDASVESVFLVDGSERDRWHFHAIRGKSDDKASVLIMSKDSSIDDKATQWTGVWVNGDNGVGETIVELFRKQRVRVADDALVIDIDASRESKIQGLALTGGGSVALGLLVLVAFAVTIKDDEKDAKKLKAGKKAMKDDLERTKLALRQAIQPYLRDPEQTVQVRANCLMSKMPQVVLGVDADDHQAPPELVAIIMALHQELQRRKIRYEFMNYTTFHVEDEGWRDTFEVS